MVINHFLGGFVSVNDAALFFSNFSIILVKTGLFLKVFTSLPIFRQRGFESLLGEINEVQVLSEIKFQDFLSVRHDLVLSRLVLEVVLFKGS